MAACETVKIVNKNDASGYSVINKSDMTDKDVIFKESAPKKKRKVSAKE